MITHKLNGHTDRVLLILGFILQLLAFVFGYGKLSQKADDLNERTVRIERFIDEGRIKK